MSKLLLTVGTLVAILLGARSAAAQCEPQWRNPHFGPRCNFGAVFDQARGEVVVYGGAYDNDMGRSHDDTWVWNGTTWRLAATEGPNRRSRYAMAYDSWREVVLLTGGLGGAGTWGWDGVSWERLTLDGPTSRWGSAMAFDESRGRVVLFGGYTSDYLGDTWEWDGDSWEQAQPATSPAPRYGHAMCYDPSLGRVVLFGGRTGQLQRSRELWSWTGESWELLDSGSIPERYEHAMTYDTQRGAVVVSGGYGGSSWRDTWEWSGSGWTRAADLPHVLRGHAMVHDPLHGVTLSIGGDADHNGPTAATLQYADGSWSLLHRPGPEARYNTAMVWDSTRQRAFMCGGDGSDSFGTDAWTWDGSTWSEVAGGTPPISRHGMAYDSLRDRIVRFGGSFDSDQDGEYFRNLTWEFDGASWTSSNAPSPPLRKHPAMVFHEADGVTMLFGGQAPSGAPLGDTWTWDGTAWTQLPIGGPPARDRAAMAYDASSESIVLFGGAAGYGDEPMDDTWVFHDGVWTEAAVGAGPSARYGAYMAYDPIRERILLFGGRDGDNSNDYFNDTWAWDGSGWTPLSLGEPRPLMRHAGGAVFDPERDAFVVFSGYYTSTAGGCEDTWLLTAAPPEITTHPRDAQSCLAGDATFAVAALQTAGQTYRWRKGGVPLSDGVSDTGSQISGSTTPVLTVRDVRAGDLADYDCVVSTGCGDSTSDVAALVACIADFNCDDAANTLDVLAFLNAWAAGDSHADLNADGSVNTLDVLQFLNLWTAGC